MVLKKNLYKIENGMTKRLAKPYVKCGLVTVEDIELRRSDHSPRAAPSEPKEKTEAVVVNSDTVAVNTDIVNL